ncbi:MAG: 16S rRNA (cytidine(1402)-2'-O)-methyltransferase [Bacteroidales bacterium]|nr:16S rRNA (cytidine(1402)-2'-O)-methyltransferase [Bacteroidales bacterium]MCF8402518.1 16S rRNA (cytidine(1402)-2'-O)-methyltransferase [Bacteroidales bacterium]
MAKLIVVPTPIGNLEDITFRAVKVLKEVDLILAEDTRTSSKLLNHYAITTKMIAYHKFNEHKMLPALIERIRSNNAVALISDAGTPSISDPGFLIVRECVKNNIEVECLPGATAIIPALVDSGLPSDRFYFEGFIPPKKGRNTRIEFLAGLHQTFILYESPYRLVKTLEALALAMGDDRQASVSRELSKMFEETRRGSLIELAAYFTENPPKGEIVLVVEGKKKPT